MYLLDTDTLSYVARGEGGVGVRMLSMKRETVAAPAVVAYELRYGVARLDLSRPITRALTENVGSLLAALRIVAFDDECAAAAAVLRADLARAGTPLGPIDILIAATALAKRAVLVTRNTREFGRVRGLMLEDWFDPKAPRVHTLLQEPAPPRKRRTTAAARR